MRSKKLFRVIAVVLICIAVPAMAQYYGSSPLVPPTDGEYVSAPGAQSTYVALGPTFILNQVHLAGFGGITSAPTGSDLITQFSATANGKVSVNFSPAVSISLSGPVSVKLFNYTAGQAGIFNTEMLQLDLSGVIGPFPTMIRESPTLASKGQTTITPIGGGQFKIDSFFDVFTELSVDGGQSWAPDTTGPHRVELANLPEPTTLGLLIPMAAVLMRRKIRK